MAQVLDLPINVPWTLIAASEDMMEQRPCDTQFPLEWRSSIALSAFEPKAEDLPPELCDTTITFLKVTCNVTGLQASKDETKRGHDELKVKVADLRAILDSLYLACYGTLVNVAVTPSPATRTQHDTAGTNFVDLEPGDQPNPLVVGDVAFGAVQAHQNRVLDLTLDDGTQHRVLDLQREMEVTVPTTSTVKVKLVHRTAEVTVDAFHGTQPVGLPQRAGPAGEQVDTLQVKGEGIDRVVLRASDDTAFLTEFLREVPIGVEDFPHIIDFEPKMRDLYQAATEDGEVLTASTSEVKTDKSHTRTESSETGVSVEGKASIGIASLAAGLSHRWGESEQDTTQVQTDASRDRRERYATTTNITQMYNLLTGYHLGTNRAVFLMLPRPHVLPPTDFRTFVQGLRYIEGVQEFFLVVARPSDVTGLSVNATLETGHFREDVKFDFPPEEFKLDSEQFIVTAESDQDKRRSIEEFPSSKYNVRAGMVIDRSGTPRGKDAEGHPLPAGDPFHNGIQFLGGQDEVGPLNPPAPEDPSTFPGVIEGFNYQPASDATVQVMGRIVPRPLPHGTTVRHVTLLFKVFTRSQQPIPSTARPKVDTSGLVITGRRLCVSFQSGDCPKVTEVVSESPEQLIIDEQMLQLNPDLLTLTATTASRLPAMKDLQRAVQVAMASSARLPSRRPLGAVGFLESDFFTDSVKDKLPPEVTQLSLANVRDLPQAVVQAFPRKGEGPFPTVADALKEAPDLAAFAARTGLGFKDAAKARFTLLTAIPIHDPDEVP
jgi:hypothetical protein